MSALRARRLGISAKEFMSSFAGTRKENDEIGLLPLKISHHLSALPQK